MIIDQWTRRFRRIAAAMGAAIVCAGLGCASSSESVQRDTLTSHVGKYDPPPSGVVKPRVGVPPFSVRGSGIFGGADMNDLAADQMTTLLDASERFNVVERAQLQKLLDEQKLGGVVKPGEVTRSGQISGVDYLLVGKVTDLRVKKEDKTRGFGLAQVGGWFNVGGADVKKKDVILTTEAGVDIRLVDPATGNIVVSNFSEYKRTDTAAAIGVDILGASADADANINIDEDDKGKILRLALDDAFRKSLKKIDRFLVNGQLHVANGNSAVPTPSTNPSGNMPGASTPAAAKKLCKECGTEITVGTKFCPHCGAKIE